MLVILGYSINDTVVIYDRIRENGSMVNKKHTDFAQLVNTGINQSLTRTINTTLTTLLALGTVCGKRRLWAGQHLHLFVPSYHWHGFGRIQFHLHCRAAVG